MLHRVSIALCVVFILIMPSCSNQAEIDRYKAEAAAAKAEAAAVKAEAAKSKETGTNAEQNHSKQQLCLKCQGSGTVATKCGQCSGTGKKDCPFCKGSGQQGAFGGAVCGVCQGRKVVSCNYYLGKSIIAREATNEEKPLLWRAYCKGDGVVNTTCDICKGTGKVKLE